MKVEPSKSGSSVLATVDVCAIDADIIAHKVASACDGKFYIYEGKEYGLLKDIKADYPDGFNRESVGTAYEPEEWEDVVSSLKSMISTIKRDIEAKEYLFFLSKGETFRHKVASILPYKGNRKDVHVPRWLYDVKDYIVKEYGGVYGDGVEADDMLHIGDVIASIDKDLLTIPKVHYNLDKRTVRTVDPLEADANFYCQVLTGDKTDNILGLFGVGDKSAYCKKVRACEDVIGMHEIVEEAYVSRFGQHADYFLDETCTLVWIQQGGRRPFFRGAAFNMRNKHEKRYKG